MQLVTFLTPWAVGQAARIALRHQVWNKEVTGRDGRLRSWKGATSHRPQAASQGPWAASKNWEGTETGFTPEPPKGHAALPTTRLSPSDIRVRPRTYGTISNHDLLFEATKFMGIGDASHRKHTDTLVPRAGAAVINTRKMQMRF